MQWMIREVGSKEILQEGWSQDVQDAINQINVHLERLVAEKRERRLKRKDRSLQVA